MKFLVVLAAVAAVATCWNIPSDQEVANQWQTFKAAHGKTYDNDVEEAHRIKIFKENLIKIAKHNERFDAGKVTFKVGVNKFTDMLTHEVTAKLNGYRGRGGVRHPDSPVHEEPADELSLPWNKFDWRTKGYVTPVKDQGNCGACWSFSTTGAIEGQFFKKTGKLVSLSEQNLIDCSKNDGNNGCKGGDMVPSFKYIIDNGGIDTDVAYPYERKSDTCRYSKENSAGTITGYVHVQAYSEKALHDAVTRVGPIAVSIDASQWSFLAYSSGIYYDEKCITAPDQLDHAVLAVGYGSDGPDGKDYWIVKNSWGVDWGERGYIRMARNRDNNCGIASDASYPTV